MRSRPSAAARSFDQWPVAEPAAQLDLSSVPVTTPAAGRCRGLPTKAGVRVTLAVAADGYQVVGNAAAPDADC